MEALRRFKYNTLEPSQIRLLSLLPPKTTSEQVSDRLQLRCSMKTVSLQTKPKPKYTALSYTWGNPSRTSLLMVNESTNEGTNDPINISESALYITKSVETVLLHLVLHRITDTMFWIDQLCINQDDYDEKNSQVLLMKAIYEGANDVVVWLGPAADESDRLIDILNTVGAEACKAGLQPGASILEMNQAFKVSHSELTKSSSLGPGFTISTKSMQSFVDRQWWRRVWVVQELSLARSVNFVCGYKKISYEDLHSALLFYGFYGRQLVKDFQDRYSTARILFDTKKRQELFALTSAPVNSAADQMLTSRLRYRRQIEGNSGYSLYRILEISHVLHYSKTRLNATDHRDKIFGFLGLAKDAEKLDIRADYNKRLCEVYIEVARALIACGHVDLLWFCQFPKLTNCLPTWVPDWSADIKTPYGDRFSKSSRPFAASGDAIVHTDHAEKIKGSGRFITLHGAFVDEVEVIGSEWVEPPDGNFDVTAAYQFIQEINMLCDEVSSNGTRQDPGILEEARWRTPIGDMEWNDNSTPKRATKLSREVYKELLRRIEMRNALDSPPEQWLRWLLHALTAPFLRSKTGFPIEINGGKSYFNFMKEMFNRRPLRTKNGYMGLGPVGMLPNDVVCVVLGAQVPYILRPCDAVQYQLIGESYIHGIMDGEFMEKQPVTKEFTLC